MRSRISLVEQLLRLQRPVPEAVAELRVFGWDSDEVLATLDRQDIVSVLKRYLLGEISAPQVEEWANAIEGREDVGFEGGIRGIAREALHELANPLLTRYLTPSTADEWVRRLS